MWSDLMAVTSTHDLNFWNDYHKKNTKSERELAHGVTVLSTTPHTTMMLVNTRYDAVKAGHHIQKNNIKVGI